MKNFNFTILAVVVWIVVSSPADAGWQFGTAKVKITPDQYMWMSGYGGRDHPAEGKLTDLWAKVLVLENESGDRAVLITADIIGIGREFMQQVFRELRARYQLKRSEVAICTSHTHTGPAVGGNLTPLHYWQIGEEQQKLVDDYTSILQSKIVNAVHSAINRMSPGKLSWGNGRSTFAVNRRDNKPEGNVLKWRTEGTLKGPIDHDVPVLAIRDNEENLKAVVFGYACHATVLSSYQWSGDYPGFAQLELEKNQRGCLAMFWAGCGADQNPLPRRSVELARHYGRRLANAVESVLLTTHMQDVNSELRTSYREIEIPYENLPSRAQWEDDAKDSNRFVAARAKMLIDQIEKGQPLKPSYPYPVGVWKLGRDLQFVFLGGEVCVDFAIRLKTENRGIRTWVSGYANDVMAYIPSRRVWLEGGYEGADAMVYYGLPNRWDSNVESLIIAEANEQLK